MNKVMEIIKKIIWFLSPRSRGEELHYISGGEALPLPLTAEEESSLISKASQGDMLSKNKLIEHNLRLVVYISKRFENTGAEQEDLVSVGTIGLIKAVNSFSAEKKIKLATFASRCIENEILMYLRKLNKTKMEVSFEEPLNVDGDGNVLVLSDVLGSDENEVYRELEESVEKDCLLQIFLRLPKREREIVEMRYGLFGKEELTQKEIAEKLGISQSYISRLEKKIIAGLKRELLKH